MKRLSNHLVAIAIMIAMLTSGCDNVQEGDISSAELVARIEGDKTPLILDVRTVSEFTVSHIPGAVNIPHTEINKRLAELPEDKSVEIVVHCVSGVRAANAKENLTVAGYQNIRLLDGHFAQWSRQELPVTQGVTR